MWCMLLGKRRRQDGNFPGSDVILQQLKEKPARKRVGIITESGPPPRGTCCKLLTKLTGGKFQQFMFTIHASVKSTQLQFCGYIPSCLM